MPTEQQLRRINRHRLSQIANAMLNNNHNIPGSLRDDRVGAFLKDYHIKGAAIREKFRTMSLTDVMAAARRLDLFSPCNEMVEWYRKSKGAGRKPRLICDFGPEQTIRHTMIGAAVDAQLINGDAFYDRKGFGVPAAVTAIIEAIHEVGPYVLSADIADCFPSINMEAVYELNILPPEVIRYALDYRNLPFLRKENNQTQSLSYLHTHDYSYSPYGHGTTIGGGPSGLLQGSAASNAILRHILRDAVGAVDPRARIVVFVDNFFVVGSTEDVCSRVKETLSCHLADCAAGPLLFGRADIYHIREGLDVLGYHLLMGPDNQVGIDLSQKNLGKLESWIEGALCELRKLPGWTDFSTVSAVNRAQIFGNVLQPFPMVDDIFRQAVMDMIN